MSLELLSYLRMFLCFLFFLGFFSEPFLSVTGRIDSPEDCTALNPSSCPINKNLSFPETFYLTVSSVSLSRSSVVVDSSMASEQTPYQLFAACTFK